MSPRLRAKVDAVQPDVVAALEEVGCAVQRLAEGGGVPDLLVYSPWLARGSASGSGLLLIECKSGRGGELTPAQERWITAWPGAVYVVRSPEEARRAAGVPALESVNDVTRRTPC